MILDSSLALKLEENNYEKTYTAIFIDDSTLFLIKNLFSIKHSDSLIYIPELCLYYARNAYVAMLNVAYS